MNKVILVTGVSTGFGKATAQLLAEAGHKVYGTVRKESSGPQNISILKMDLTDQKSIKQVVQNIVQKEGRIDILINNAGMHIGGPFETTPLTNIKLLTDTNISGTIILTREVLPIMREQGGGKIFNLSSIGGLMGLPFQAFYSAGKFAIEGFSEALRMEVKPFNIEVILINPGDFCTNNTANRRKYLAPVEPDDPYYEQYRKSLDIIEKDERSGWDPSFLAKKICKIIENSKPRQRYIIAPFGQKLAVVLKYLLPGKIFRKIIENHYGI
ncbi:MAG TPA: SDR family oxidoreductase [Bacteroidales bacterium]|nr:SDR family oxidoreductase [Bacteroidales bacterium]HPI67661.1 SDR family oxidoreductase [Bacteroidales bacterium]HPR72034.1 SDR family oxidoreductase [Bacteroidales bacterium]